MTRDLGSDTGSVVLNLEGKLLELLLRIFEKIYEAWYNAPKRKLETTAIKEAKTAEERKKALSKVQTKVGKISNGILVKSGEPVTMCGIRLAKDEIKDFSAICGRMGIVFAAVSDQHLKKDGEKAYLAIKCRTADLEKMKEAVERFNHEKREKAIDAKINGILAKGKDSLTEQDFADLKELNRQKEDMQRGYCEKLNEQMASDVIRRAFDEGKLKPMDIGEALNRNTGRSLDKDRTTYIADAQDPGKVIVCHGYNDVDHKGEKYIKTDYEVYHGRELKLKTHDGRFEGRTSDFWDRQKEKIADAADFSGTYYKFFSKDEYEKWAEYAKEKNAEMEAPEMEGMGIKNDAVTRESLERQLDSLGMEVNDGGDLCRKGSDVPLRHSMLYKDKGISRNEKLDFVEGVTIRKQIVNCEEISRASNDLAVAEARVLVSKEGTKEHDEAAAYRQSLRERLEGLKGREKELVKERREINAIRAEVETAGERGEAREMGGSERKGAERNEAAKFFVTLQKSDGAKEKQAEAYPDHIDAFLSKLGTLDRYKREIGDEKAKDAANKPVEIARQKDKAAKER